MPEMQQVLSQFVSSDVLNAHCFSLTLTTDSLSSAEQLNDVLLSPAMYEFSLSWKSQVGAKELYGLLPSRMEVSQFRYSSRERIRLISRNRLSMLPAYLWKMILSNLLPFSNPLFGLSQLVRFPNLKPTLPLLLFMIAPRDWTPSSKETTPLAYRYYKPKHSVVSFSFHFLSVFFISISHPG